MFLVSVFLYSALLVSSLVSRGNSAKIVNFTCSEPSLSLVWAQNQPTLGKIPGILRVPGKPRVYLENTRYFAGSSVSPQILAQTSSQTQGNSRVARMEHQTPSALWLVSLEISGNEKCWGPSRFLFGFRKQHGYRPMRPSQRSGRLSLSVMKNFGTNTGTP